MPKAFLSHSSKQKGYVEVIARHLGKDKIVYDSWTFEEGEEIKREISNHLDKSDIFVLFISEEALESPWVQSEIKQAEELFTSGSIKQFYPIIIDENIDYKDDRIPNWIKENYILRYISRPSKAAERIKQKLRLITWELSPKNKKYQQLFIGRQELIKEFEDRIYDFETPNPFCIVASGLNDIGRRKFLTHALINSNKIKSYYRPLTIKLESRDSIENFLLYVYDLGLSPKMDLTNLISKTIDQKIDLAKSLIEDLYKNDSLLYIIDNYSIVSQDGNIVDWFMKLSKNYEERDKTIICLISIRRVNPKPLWDYPNIFALKVPELNQHERKALFKACLDIEGLQLTLEEFNTISGLFSGFPEEIFYTVNLIKKIGLSELMNKSYLIVDFNSEKVSSLLKKYSEDQEAQSLLKLLSTFPFISLNYLNTLLEGESVRYHELLFEFINSSIIEFIGATKDNLRLNDSIKDFIERTERPLSQNFVNKIRISSQNVLADYEDAMDRDISEYIKTVQFAFEDGSKVPISLLIPSHFLNRIRDLYNVKRKYSDVITLADQILTNKQYLDSRIEREIYYWLCLALARTKSERFLREVQNISGPDHNLLLGFYYRLTKRYGKAIGRLTEVLKSSPRFYRARRELVQVYLNLEEYDKAFYLAEENYKQDKNNAYNLQSYFRCLISQQKANHKKKEELKILLIQLEKIGTSKAREMYYCASAQFEAYIERNIPKSIQTINEGITAFPHNLYPKLAKIEICSKFENLPNLKTALSQYENHVSHQELDTRFGYLSGKIKALILDGKSDDALNILESKIKPNFPESAYDKISQFFEK